MPLFRSIPLLGAVLGQTDDDATHLLQTATVRQHSAMSGIAKNENVEDGCYFGTCRTYSPADTWSKDCWEQKDSYYVGEGHGLTNECFATLSEAMDACDAATDCGAIATQSNVGNGCYRVTHGGPTWHIWADWQRYSLRAWARKGGAGQGECTPPTTTTTTTTTTTKATTAAPTTTAGGADATISPGTDSPGGDTEVTDADCLDAETGFGPGFTCANTEMYCSTDSGDGMTVGACCPTKCKKEFENKKKNNRAENKAKNDIERRIKRNENERSRKQAEKARKKDRKDTEWNNKRDLKEAKNKNEEGERKNKRGLTENARKNEQNWKKNKEARRKAANKREKNRKEKRSKSAPAPTPPSKQAKKCKRKMKNWNRCAGKKKCEKGQKKKGKSAPSC